MDVHTKGIRVIKVEPDLVRTEFPEKLVPERTRILRAEGVLSLEAEDVAEAVIYAVEQPPRVSVNEILIRPTERPK
jgi:NADP-dependent 3-hydroxy acid dehydrogenase YdfG